jgi:hypothetical protein
VILRYRRGFQIEESYSDRICERLRVRQRWYSIVDEPLKLEQMSSGRSVRVFYYSGVKIRSRRLTPSRLGRDAPYLGGEIDLNSHCPWVSRQRREALRKPSEALKVDNELPQVGYKFVYRRQERRVREYSSAGRAKLWRSSSFNRGKYWREEEILEG